jgi:hypothetical protein
MALVFAHFYQLTLKPAFVNNPKVCMVCLLGITNKQYILVFPLLQDWCLVLVRSAPNTFHILDVDDFTSIIII